MRELDDEALGWFGRRLPWGSYGMPARASLTAPTLGVALRRELAEQHLLGTAWPIERVAAAVGFANDKSFARAFRAWTGCSPAAWRKRARRAADDAIGAC